MNIEEKQNKLDTFDANGLGAAEAQIFGLPFTYDESEVVILPIPWEVTVSYQTGAAKGPKAIFEASMQVDLFDDDLPHAWQRGIFMQKISAGWKQKNTKLRKKAVEYIDALSDGKLTAEHSIVLNEINAECTALKDWVYAESKNILDEDKLLGLLGGDHSTPLGYMWALADKYEEYGILHIDAHADLRDAYEGFNYSHASIMFNALKIPQVKKLIQVGLRDVCEAEMEIINNGERRVIGYFNHEIKTALFSGMSWKIICDQIIDELPQHVYISFDIDGLDPKNCPNTGTPVPGGLEYDQAVYLIQRLVESGRKIIGFDLVEVAPGKDEWDANVGARLLYKLCNLMMKSQHK
ncbi:MAG: agmatinase family protein [Fimbriimonadaceae bacterium]|nr:agmatinase family protein [Chitinophagales bacterium]